MRSRFQHLAENVHRALRIAVRLALLRQVQQRAGVVVPRRRLENGEQLVRPIDRPFVRKRDPVRALVILVLRVQLEGSLKTFARLFFESSKIQPAANVVLQVRVLGMPRLQQPRKLGRLIRFPKSGQRVQHLQAGFWIVALLIQLPGGILNGLIANLLPLVQGDHAMSPALRTRIENLLFSERNNRDKNDDKPKSRFVSLQIARLVTRVADAARFLQILPAVIPGADSVHSAGHKILRNVRFSVV